MFLSRRTPHRGLSRPFAMSAGGGLAAVIGLLLAGMKSAAQQPPPLPQPKPIVVAPMPRPGQAAPRPKPSPLPAESEGAQLERKESTPAPRTRKTSAPKAAEVSYGTTPVPWPKGSSDPAHFPQEIPRFPGARQASFSMSILVASAFFLCDQAPEEIARFYLAFVEREKWTPVPIPGPPLQGDRIVIAEKGDWTLRVDAVRNPLDGATEVFLSAALKPLPPAKPEGKTP